MCFVCSCVSPCLPPDIETMPCCRVAPHLPFLMVIRVIAWLPNNVVQLPGNGLRVLHSLNCPRPRDHGQLCVNANAVQTLMPNGTTNTTRLNETYIPHWPKWLSPYTPSFPVSLPSCNAAGDRWPLNAFLNAIIGQPSSTSSGPNIRVGIGTDTKRYLSVSAIRQRCLAQYDINFGDADIVSNISRYIGCPAWRLHHFVPLAY